MTSERFELTTLPYACFSVQLKDITFDTIQEVLEQAYTQMLANPKYLFCNEEDRKLFVSAPIYRHNLCGESEQVSGPFNIAQLANYTTGQLMHIVTLPDLERGKLLFGFMEY